MRKFDLGIIIPVFFLLLTGIFQIVSYASGAQLLNYFIAVGLGIAAMLVFTFTKYKAFLRFRAVFLYVFGIILLGATLFLGKTVNFCRSWLDIGFVIFQPSEIAKFSTVIILTYFLGKNYSDRNSLKTILFITLFSAIPFLLVLKQPDIGSSLVFIFIFFIFLYLSQNFGFFLFVLATGSVLFAEIVYFCLHQGIDFRIFRPLAAFLVIFFIVAKFFLRIKKTFVPVLSVCFFFLLTGFFSYRVAAGFKRYQKDRLLNFVKPSRDVLNSGYHLEQSLIAIGSGKFTGKGYRRGTQSRLGFLPGRYKDFIFASIAEEFGFLGVFLLLAAYFILFSRMIKISALSLDREGTFITLAVFGVLFFQTVLNIGGVIGILPITGLPLPFVSYGGTALVVYLSMVGIVLNVYLSSRG
ncbi:MAG: FtsW/RodA/SpoVE family cell cycle protein [bacterium]